MSWWQQHSQPIEVLVCGASRGIGLALCAALLAKPQVARVWAVARQAGQSAELQRLAGQHPGRLRWRDLDIADEAALQAFAAELRDVMPHLHLLLNCVGVLQEGPVHAEKSLAQVDLAGLQASFLRNAFAPLLLLKHLLPLLRGRHPCQVAMLSARVGSIADNRLGGWYSYRASKAALNQLLHTASIELARLNPNACVLSLHPGTTDTELSRPFQANVPNERLFSPAFVAARLLAVLASKTPADSGSFRAWDDQPIPW